MNISLFLFYLPQGTARTWRPSATPSQTPVSQPPPTGPQQHSLPLPNPPQVRLAEGRTTMYRASIPIDADLQPQPVVPIV